MFECKEPCWVFCYSDMSPLIFTFTIVTCPAFIYKCLKADNVLSSEWEVIKTTGALFKNLYYNNF